MKQTTLMTASVCAALLSSVTWRQSVNADPANKQCHNPVARLMTTGDSRLRKGATLCRGTQLKALSDNRLIVKCLRPLKYINVVQGEAGLLCDRAATEPRSQRLGLWDYNNPRGSYTLALQRPFGSILNQPHPIIEWNKVAGAIRHEVRVEGSGIRWRQNVAATQTEIQYPDDQPGFQAGQAYKVTVLAHLENSVDVAKSVYRVLPEATAQRIVEAEQLIQSEKLSLSQEAIERDALYMSFGMLDQTITNLEIAVRSGANDSVRTLLSQRYAYAGFNSVEPD